MNVDVSAAAMNEMKPAPAASPAPATDADSGFMLLADNRVALLSRIVVVDNAQRTLDVQYYIIRGDLTGLLLMQRVLAAADRGVHVRILVDDIARASADKVLAAFAVHDNIDVRFFNPILGREPSFLSRVWQILTRLRHLNRRMHNKALIADGDAAIIGGRNLGDEYFDAGTQVNFSDLDLIVFGKAATEIGKSFEHFWASKAAFASRKFRRHPIRKSALDQVRTRLAAHLYEAKTSEFGAGLSGDIGGALSREHALDLYRGKAHVVFDDVSKIDPDPPRWRVRKRRPARVAPAIRAALEAAQSCITLISPYFVPGLRGSQLLEDLRARGVRIRVLTNSLAATDVPAVHAGYQRYRVRLLRAGVELFEMRADPFQPRSRMGSSSGASLHAKALTIDRHCCMVGSMNLDPRSAFLNTELGVLVESVDLTARIDEYFDELSKPEHSFCVTLDNTQARERLRWHGADRSGTVQTLFREPDAGFARRWKARIFSWLPFEDQL